jgi:hypothetical protein
VAESVPEPVKPEKSDQKPDDTDEKPVHENQHIYKIEEPSDLLATTEPSLHEACEHKNEEEPAQVDTEIDPQ